MAPKIKSDGLVVVAEPLLLVALLPELAAVISTGLLRFAPLYSITLMSAYDAAVAKVTVTLLVPAAADAMLFA